MEFLPFHVTPPLLYGLAALHCLNGTIGALIAQRRGYAFRRWFLWGLLGGSITIVCALIAKPVQ
jgi:hypothetical protein